MVYLLIMVDFSMARLNNQMVSWFLILMTIGLNRTYGFMVDISIVHGIVTNL